MGNILTRKKSINSEYSIPLISSSGLSIESSKCELDNHMIGKYSRDPGKIPDSELEDYLTNSQKYNDTIALSYLFSVI
jgi:hypothetical protein